MPIAHRARVIPFVCFLGFFCIREALGQGFSMHRPPEFGIEVAGPTSRLANVADWPVTFIFRMPGSPGCTATAIGAHVILTAAHCLPADSSGTLTIDQQQLAVKCNRHPRWPQVRTADFALCYVESALRAPTGGFETLTFDDTAVVVQTEVTLLGFGCRFDGSPGFGLLVQGTANVITLTAESIDTGAGSTLCTGDSGGAAYLATGSYAGRRRVAALNHASDSVHSVLSRIAHPEFKTWATQWSNSTGAALCGLDPAASNCRP